MEIAASAMLDGLKNNRISKLALSRFLSQNNIFVTECTNNVKFRTITTEYLIEWSNSMFTLSQTLRRFPARGIKLNFASEEIIIFVSHGIPSISSSWLNIWTNKIPGDPDAAERKMRNIYRGYILHIGCGERIRSSRFDRVIFLDNTGRDKSPHCVCYYFSFPSWPGRKIVEPVLERLIHKLLFLLLRNYVCYRVMALRRIGSTIAHKSKSSYLRPSYVLVLQANETLWKKIVLIIFVVNCLHEDISRIFEAVFSLIVVSLDSGRDFFREQRGGANVSKAQTPRIDALQLQLRGWTGRRGRGADTRRKASVSDATSLRSDRSDLTRAPPSYACQAQQDARSSDSSRARSTVICVTYPAAGLCLRYGRTSDRRAIARKYDARDPYDGNWCDAAMRRRENTMPVRNAIGEKSRKRGFAASRLVPELAQTSLWPASYEVEGEVYMQISGGRYNRRYAVKKVERKAMLQIFTAVVTHEGVLEESFSHIHLNVMIVMKYYHDNSSYIQFNNFSIVAQSYLIRSIVTFYPHILVYAPNGCTIRFSKIKKTGLREVSYFVRSCEWMLVIEAFTGAIGLVSGSKICLLYRVERKKEKESEKSAFRRCKQYCKTTLVIQTKCKLENFVVWDVSSLEILKKYEKESRDTPSRKSRRNDRNDDVLIAEGAQKPKVIITIARELGDFQFSHHLELGRSEQPTLRFRVPFIRIFQDTFALFLIVPSVLSNSQWKRNFCQRRWVVLLWFKWLHCTSL
ncbi:hypothetical protein G5I_08136 [Acromyrmex echinatior]|uniref:Uncharacterized protein n=1 Tax=Acromyrmex echinatior TaxID=103372 RepID=F4WQP5_ACREC|nr:hypothetical protein G5I_08136 [Acromyrmex echinatior]